MSRAGIFALCALGCASGPTMTGVGVASPPGRNRTEGAPRVIAARPPPAPEHQPSDPIPRFDEPPPRPSEQRGPGEEPVAGGVSAGAVWEDPSGRAGAFLQAVRARTTALTLVQLGDSHTEGDAWTGALRRALVRRVGDAGRGFVPLAGTQRDVRRALQGPWRVVRSSLRGSEGPMGLGLARAVASVPAATLRVSTCADCPAGATASRVTVFYRALPQGGSFNLRVDDATRTVSTRSGEQVTVDVPEGPHDVTVSPVGDGPIELFGVALDRDGLGARVESAGLIGAQAVHLEREHWPTLAAQLTARAPALVALAFGTNESVAVRRDPTLYEQALTALVARVREAVPQATVALLGPPDTAVRGGAPGAYLPAPRLDEIIAAGRRVAQAQGALFVDVTALMRARGGVQAWVDARPSLAEPDHVHLTRRGYEALAEAMADALLGSSTR